MAAQQLHYPWQAQESIADIETVNIEGETLLHFAIVEDNLPVLKALLSGGANDSSQQ